MFLGVEWAIFLMRQLIRLIRVHNDPLWVPQARFFVSRALQSYVVPVYSLFYSKFQTSVILLLGVEWAILFDEAII